MRVRNTVSNLVTKKAGNWTQVITCELEYVSIIRLMNDRVCFNLKEDKS